MTHGIHSTLKQYAVPIDSVTPHPTNPRRGDVAAIAKSLETNGQYKPIICRTGDRTILAGNHTYAAALRLGWTEIAASFVDVDDQEAMRILLADNRHSDLATYDDFALADLLVEVQATDIGLEGTGWTDPDLADLLADAEQPLRLGEDPPGPGLGGGGAAEKAPSEPVAYVRAPDFTAGLDLGALADFKERFKGKAGLLALQVALDWPAANAKLAGTTGTTAVAPVGSEEDLIVTNGETALVADLKPHPSNPRQGDVGAIAQSLVANGQYRPIVVSKRTMHVLAGTHTLYAARSLGWERVLVTWVDVDEDAEARIVLVDNRLADKGSYDLDTLLASLQELPDLDGTGFALEDLDDLQAQINRQDPARKGKAAILFVDESEEVDCRLSLRCEWPAYDDWYNRHADGPGGLKAYVLAAVGLT